MVRDGNLIQSVVFYVCLLLLICKVVYSSVLHMSQALRACSFVSGIMRYIYHTFIIIISSSIVVVVVVVKWEGIDLLHLTQQLMFYII